MTTPISTKKILKAIGNDKLTLVKVVGQRYHHFQYEDASIGAYHEKIVFSQYLNDLEIGEWIEEGQDCIATALKDADFRGVGNYVDSDGSFRIKITEAKF